MKTPLPGGCSHSRFTVSPSNWLKAGASVKHPWRIYYRFYDSEGKSKQIAIKGMNIAPTLEARRLYTKELIRNQKESLEAGYNPITGSTTPVDTIQQDVHELTPLFIALRAAVPLQDCIKKTREAIERCVGVMASCGSGLNTMPVGAVRPKHVLQILRTVSAKKNMSACNYNHYRSYLMMLFKTLIPMGCIDINPVRDIPRRKTIKKKKRVLTLDERLRVKEALNTPKRANFYRYVQMFFASGARSTELLSIKIKDIDLVNQRYTCTIRKGRQWEEVDKTITDDVLHLWRHQVELANSPEDYLFGRYLVPRPQPTSSYQISARWHKFIKSPKTGLGIPVDFYKLKHLRSTEIVDLLDTRAAAELNSHKSEAMVIGIYDTKNAEREHKKLKTINQPF